jgi:phosphohistidine phosphatase
MKTLVICRHAKSDWSHDLPDKDRPLNSRGEQDAPKMGQILQSYGFMPDLILSSTANRAITTARLVASELGYAEHNIRLEPRFYDTTPGMVLGLLQDVPEEVETLMIFGHNPTWELLGKLLLRSDGEVVMPTCGMICLEVPISNWQHLGAVPAHLRWFLVPRIFENATWK